MSDTSSDTSSSSNVEPLSEEERRIIVNELNARASRRALITPSEFVRVFINGLERAYFRLTSGSSSGFELTDGDEVIEVRLEHDNLLVAAHLLTYEDSGVFASGTWTVELTHDLEISFTIEPPKASETRNAATISVSHVNHAVEISGGFQKLLPNISRSPLIQRYAAVFVVGVCLGLVSMYLYGSDHKRQHSGQGDLVDFLSPADCDSLRAAFNDEDLVRNMKGIPSLRDFATKFEGEPRVLKGLVSSVCPVKTR